MVGESEKVSPSLRFTEKVLTSIYVRLMNMGSEQRSLCWYTLLTGPVLTVYLTRLLEEKVVGLSSTPIKLGGQRT